MSKLISMKDYKMAKSKVNQNNVFAEDDGDIEQDMKTLGQVRDVLLEDFKAAQTITDKLVVAELYSHLTPKAKYIETYKKMQLDYDQNIIESVIEAQKKAS